jgi:hypothetical protein
MDAATAPPQPSRKNVPRAAVHPAPNGLHTPRAYHYFLLQIDDFVVRVRVNDDGVGPKALNRDHHHFAGFTMNVVCPSRQP